MDRDLSRNTLATNGLSAGKPHRNKKTSRTLTQNKTSNCLIDDHSKTVQCDILILFGCASQRLDSEEKTN